MPYDYLQFTAIDRYKRAKRRFLIVIRPQGIRQGHTERIRLALEHATRLFAARQEAAGVIWIDITEHPATFYRLLYGLLSPKRYKFTRKRRTLGLGPFQLVL
jgi:hypothetical protein